MQQSCEIKIKTHLPVKLSQITEIRGYCYIGAFREKYLRFDIRRRCGSCCIYDIASRCCLQIFVDITGVHIKVFRTVFFHFEENIHVSTICTFNSKHATMDCGRTDKNVDHNCYKNASLLSYSKYLF